MTPEQLQGLKDVVLKSIEVDLRKATERNVESMQHEFVVEFDKTQRNYINKLNITSPAQLAPPFIS